jgi:hypothetical protein
MYKTTFTSQQNKKEHTISYAPPLRAGVDDIGFSSSVVEL